MMINYNMIIYLFIEESILRKISCIIFYCAPVNV